MKVLVVDDEALARRHLIRKLEAVADVEVVGEAANGREALAQIDRLAPDLVLLDISMPELDGLTAVRGRPELPAIIFVTAHSEHALEAFELAAVDYLLKPVQSTRLHAALTRARARHDHERTRAALERLQRAQGSAQPAPALPAKTPPRAQTTPAPPAPRLRARAGDAVHLFSAPGITRLFSRDKYTVFLADGREWLLDESLAELESRLRGCGFLRVHRSELVNLEAVTALRKRGAGGTLELRDGQQAAVSRRHLGEPRRRLAARAS